jgi:hypothetical protein
MKVAEESAYANFWFLLIFSDYFLFWLYYRSVLNGFMQTRPYIKDTNDDEFYQV